jgi:hypothetical protein
MNDSLDEDSRKLLAAYQERIRPFFEQQQLPGVEALDRHAELLEQALRRPLRVRVGFVGEAQVGKSTLINAVVGRRVLPTGGIGPLTARATSVEFTDDDRMTVKYHGRAAINRLVFGMTRYLEAVGEVHRETGREQEMPPEADAVGGDLDDQVAGSSEGEVSKHARETGEYMLLQAQRMLGLDPGSLQSPRRILVDAMRAVIGLKVTDESALAPFRSRIAELESRVGKEESISASEIGGREGFNAELKLRAADWLSPLISDLQLGLKSELVRDLSLVDLPGIGTVGDPAARVARDFVERDGHALVVVFRNSGLTEAVASLLERTGVVTRMLFGGTEGHPPIHLLLAVTHLDDVAETRWLEAASDSSEDGPAVPDSNRLFQQLSSEMEHKIRSQVHAALLRSESFSDLNEQERDSREGAVRHLCESMDVVCISAPQFLKMTAPPKQSTWLTDPAATGIPRFRDALRQMAQEAAARRARDIEQYESALRRSLCEHLAIVRTQYSDGKGAATEEWERFRAELSERLIPIRTEMQARHGEALGVLRRGLQDRIGKVCGDAQIQGQKRLQRLKRSGNDLHYQSLLAALTRNGVWERRSINYPDDLSLAVLDAIATQWEPQIVEAVRGEIRELADFDLTLVDALVGAATELSPRLVAESQIEAQKKILQQNSRAAVAWTKEQLEELREKVREKLRDAIEQPIVRACRRARDAGRHQGSGAKQRILDVFDEGGTEALEDARKAAETVLKEQYRLLLRKLDTGYLEQHHDPVTAAFENLTNATGQRAQRQDRRRREAVLTRVGELAAELRCESSSTRIPSHE